MSLGEKSDKITAIKKRIEADSSQTVDTSRKNYRQIVEPSIIYSDELEKKPFNTIRQGTATNALTKLGAKSKDMTVDSITRIATIKKGNFTLTIHDYAKLDGLKTSTHQLLDIITVKLTNTGAKSPTIIIPLTEYMKQRGLKDRKEAKNQVKADLEVLRQTSITGEEKKGKDIQTYSFMNIADSGEVRRNGDIVFTFSNTFYHMLLGYPIMPYPARLQTINNHKNPNSYYLLRKITEHKNMNIGKKNEDTIAVKTLLAVAPFLPSYEKVMASNRNVGNRIISNFERDMGAFAEDLSWHYCHSNGKQLTEAELSDFNYSMFTGLMIRTEWKTYPDQTARLERKAKKRVEEDKSKNKTKTL